MKKRKKHHEHHCKNTKKKYERKERKGINKKEGALDKSKAPSTPPCS